MINKFILGKNGDALILAIIILLAIMVPETLIRGTLVVNLISPILFLGIFLERKIRGRDINEEYVKAGIFKLVVFALIVGTGVGIMA